jgi:hypothetical protein
MTSFLFDFYQFFLGELVRRAKPKTNKNRDWLAI